MLKSLGAIVCVTLFVGQGAGRVVTLQDLLVPAERLPAGCGIAQVPSRSDSKKGEVAFVRWEGPRVPSYPWTGADPQILASIRESLEGPFTVPDAPPPTSREIARMRLRLAEGVEEGLVAAYRQAGESRVTVVQAVQFATEDLARRSGRIHTTPNSRLVWVSAGRIRGLVSGDGPCFQAVSTHVSALSR